MDNNSYKDMADKKISSFDRVYSTDHIRMLKIFLHYIPEAYRRNLTVYIKYLELKQVLNNPHPFPGDDSKESSGTAETVQAESPRGDTSDSSDENFHESLEFSTLIHELLPFCNPREKQQFQNIENMMNSIEQMKNMMEMMEMMKDMKDMFGDGDGGFNPEMLAGMMGMNGMGGMGNMGGTNGMNDMGGMGNMGGTNGMNGMGGMGNMGGTNGMNGMGGMNGMNGMNGFDFGSMFGNNT